MNSWVFGRGDGRAIAMDVAERVVESLQKDGRIKRPYLGVGTQEVALPDAVKGKAKQESGLLLVAIEPESRAARAGLMQGDTIVALDGTPTTSLDALFSSLRKAKVGGTVKLRIVRAGELQETSVAVGESPGSR
jgi:serine protease Do